MDRLYSMQVFVRVAELSSFTKAAESLGLPKASASAYVQNLESTIGTRLFHRTTRTVQLTQDGQMFYERCLDLLTDVEDVESMFLENSGNLSGRLRVDMPVKLAQNLIIPNLPKFMAKYPKIEIELSSTDRRVDLIQEGFDCVIRVGALRDSGLIARPLGEMKTINLVSASYIKKYGKPKSLADLSNHYLVHYSTTLGGKPFGFEYFEDGKYKTLNMKGVITVNSTEAYHAACLSGFGIIQVPYVGMLNELKNGSLVEVLPKLKAEPMPVSIVYPHRRNLSRRCRAFMDWVEVELKGYLSKA